MGRRPAERGPDRALLDELFAVYDRADELFGAHRCPQSTACCRFGLTRREPYVTAIEVVAIEVAIRGRGGRWPDRRNLPPLTSSPRDESPCPLLDHQGRCAVYASRPIGCRTHWCAQATSPTPVAHDAVLALVRAIAAIAARHEADGERGRPLRRALAEVVLRRAKRARRR